MEKRNLALGLIIICFVSLIAGLLLPNKTIKEARMANTSLKSNLFANMDNTQGDKIALLFIDGVITAYAPRNYWSTEFNASYFIDSLRKATNDDKVKAIVIRINSPGGTVAASQDIYDEIMRARQKKPIVVSMADVAASGGYYIASAADRIVAQKGTMTGSIGVIMNFTDIAKLSEKVGISDNTIKSGRFKDSGSMYRRMDKSERDLFQNSVNTAYGQFINAITEGRISPYIDDDKPHPPRFSPFAQQNGKEVHRQNLTKETLLKYADGRVFLGEEAYNLGFVDAIGSVYEAENIANGFVNPETPLPMVNYAKNSGFQDFLNSLEGKFFNPMKNVLPFSVTHSSMPLMIWE